MGEELRLYTIMPLDAEHIFEICCDIEQQYNNGVCTMAMFCMTLVPEGNPPADKAAQLCRKYAAFKERLDAKGIPNGVLVQASIGHGWILGEIFPYQRYVNLNDGEAVNVVCPADEGFREYIYDAMRTIAKCEPDEIMVDDDFRLIYRDGGGCGCELHMKMFNELAGTNITREEFMASVKDGDRYSAIMIEAQRRSLVETAKVMRKGVDSVNSSLPMSFCCVGNDAEFGAEVASVLAGEGNPVVIRINNANYTAPGARNVSMISFKAASQIAKLKDSADIILAETDTCPQNRYSTSASMLHTHMCASILEGARGAKHWITRLKAYEPESGRAYRKILAKNSVFYRELARIVQELNWRGCRIPVMNTPRYSIGKAYSTNDNMSAWCSCVLERLGIPVYFSRQNGGVLCLEGDDDKKLDDGMLMDALKGVVMLASDAAKNLIARGFGGYLGADVREWCGKQPICERVSGNITDVQMNIKELVPAVSAEISSSVYNSVDKVNYEYLFPGSVIYKNSLGGTVITFCGTPRAEYAITEAFSFLNFSRKQQIIQLLSKTGEIPVYYPNDEEVFLRAADMKKDRLFCAVFNIGFDPIEKIELVFSSQVSKIEKLMPDGTYNEVKFETDGEKYILDTGCNTLEPLIIIAKLKCR